MHLTLGMTLAFSFLGDTHFYPKNAFNFKNANDSHWEIALRSRRWPWGTLSRCVQRLNLKQTCGRERRKWRQQRRGALVLAAPLRQNDDSQWNLKKFLSDRDQRVHFAECGTALHYATLIYLNCTKMSSYVLWSELKCWGSRLIINVQPYVAAWGNITVILWYKFFWFTLKMHRMRRLNTHWQGDFVMVIQSAYLRCFWWFVVDPGRIQIPKSDTPSKLFRS